MMPIHPSLNTWKNIVGESEKKILCKLQNLKNANQNVISPIRDAVFAAPFRSVIFVFTLEVSENRLSRNPLALSSGSESANTQSLMSAE
jgi:hypothetical protein